MFADERRIIVATRRVGAEANAHPVLLNSAISGNLPAMPRPACTTSLAVVHRRACMSLVASCELVVERSRAARFARLAIKRMAPLFAPARASRAYPSCAAPARCGVRRGRCLVERWWSRKCLASIMVLAYVLQSVECPPTRQVLAVRFGPRGWRPRPDSAFFTPPPLSATET